MKSHLSVYCRGFQFDAIYYCPSWTWRCIIFTQNIDIEPKDSCLFAGVTGSLEMCITPSSIVDSIHKTWIEENIQWELQPKRPDPQNTS